MHTCACGTKPGRARCVLATQKVITTHALPFSNFRTPQSPCQLILYRYLKSTQIACHFGMPPPSPSESTSIMDGPGRDLAKRNKVYVAKSQKVFSFLSPIQKNGYDARNVCPSKLFSLMRKVYCHAVNSF